jgi:GTP-binding protein
VTSAAAAADLPRDGAAEIALIGRSNVGKSSLINALVRQRVARTSAAPGKTRLANVYRIGEGGSAFYLVDLPGYGYARGDRSDIEAVTAAFFGRIGQVGRVGRVRQLGQAGRVGKNRRLLSHQPGRPDPPDLLDPPGPPDLSALLLIDARHPGLQADVDAWRWLQQTVARCAIVATKIDKLARGERIRALKNLESVHDASVLPVSAVTGEGLDELWKLIDRMKT